QVTAKATHCDVLGNDGAHRTTLGATHCDVLGNDGGDGGRRSIVVTHCDVLGNDGGALMASVGAATLAMMDAGVPMARHAAETLAMMDAGSVNDRALGMMDAGVPMARHAAGVTVVTISTEGAGAPSDASEGEVAAIIVDPSALEERHSGMEVAAIIVDPSALEERHAGMILMLAGTRSGITGINADLREPIAADERVWDHRS
ncbi:hypothetical protein T484DRAFT_1817163, partial [Baffinella frigidus]